MNKGYARLVLFGILGLPVMGHAQPVATFCEGTKGTLCWADGSEGKAQTEIKLQSDDVNFTVTTPPDVMSYAFADKFKASVSSWICVQTRHKYPDGKFSSWFISDTEAVCDQLSAVMPQPTVQCNDLLDNDGDGKIDFPADPGCSSSTDTDETDIIVIKPYCADGLDNDGDGKIDFPADPGCSSLTDTDETDIVIPIEKPGEVVGLRISGRIGTQVELTWETVLTAKTYTVKYISTNGNLVTLVKGLPGTTALVNLPNTGRRLYIVCAVNTKGETCPAKFHGAFATR